MQNTLSNSWALAKASASVLNRDRALLLFPLLSGIASIGVILSFVFPLWFFVGPDSAFAENTMWHFVFAFFYYLVQYFVVFYFNAALVGAALVHLGGGRPTLRDGLLIASDHAVPILGYAAISATVGVILNSIARKSGILGRLFGGSLGIGWSLATFLVVPVLVTRSVGPIEAVYESAALLKKSWGEQVAGKVGMGLVFGLAGGLLALLSVGFVAGISALDPLSLIPTYVVIALAWILFALVASSIQGIYQAAVYRYAMTGEGGVGFEHISLGEVVQRERGLRR
ncbi:MAG: hypothetical protein EA351_07480 [Gemmatimonadales bacterium]|nr:MAG: hypothetical protein EA351_07480 [Gemmatimonadales bacterium]